MVGLVRRQHLGEDALDAELGARRPRRCAGCRRRSSRPRGRAALALRSPRVRSGGPGRPRRPDRPGARRRSRTWRSSPARRAAGPRSGSPSTATPCCSSRRALPTSRLRPSTRRAQPVAGQRLEVVGLGELDAALRARPRRSRLRAGARSRALRVATSRSSSSSGSSPLATTSVRAGSPTVSVPVLSSAIASSAPMPSSVAASLIRMLCRAPIPVPTATAVGVARPSASGQAITTALIANVSVRMKSSSENSVQAAKVSEAGADRHDHEHAGGAVRQPLAGRLRVLGRSAPGR